MLICNRARRLPPARKPPPNLPLPLIPGTMSSSPSHPPNSVQLYPLRSGGSLPLRMVPPSQPPFSPKSIPGLTISPATPSAQPKSRAFMVVDDVFGSSAPYHASKEQGMETDSDAGDVMDDTPRPDSSPVRGASF